MPGPPGLGKLAAVAIGIGIVSSTLLAIPAARGADGRSRQVIAFTWNQSGTAQIWITDTTGAGPWRVTHSTADDIQPSLSPDGERIAFSRGVGYLANNVGGSIVVVNRDGTHERPLAAPSNPAVESNYRPAWSPDGRRIAYSHATSADGKSAEIWIMNADGTRDHQLTHAGGTSNYPAWSPDGRQLVFNSTRDGGNDLYLINADGTGLQRLTTTGNNTAPSWAPGDRIVFQSTRDTANRQIYALDPATGAVRRITADGDDDRFPAWAPDGTVTFGKGTLATCVLPTGLNGVCNYALWQVDADGTNPHQLDAALGEPAPPQPLFGQAYPSSPPDSTRPTA